METTDPPPNRYMVKGLSVPKVIRDFILQLDNISSYLTDDDWAKYQIKCANNPCITSLHTHFAAMEIIFQHTPESQKWSTVNRLLTDLIHPTPCHMMPISDEERETILHERRRKFQERVKQEEQHILAERLRRYQEQRKQPTVEIVSTVLHRRRPLPSTPRSTSPRKQNQPRKYSLRDRERRAPPSRHENKTYDPIDDRRKDLTDQSSVTTHTTYTSNLLSRPTVLMMASRQQEDNNRRPTDVLFLVRSAIRYLASIITGDQYRQMQIVQPMLINIKHHFDGLDESTPNRHDVLQLIEFLTNREFHHYRNNQTVEAIVNRIMIDRPDYEHGCALQHLLDQLDLIQQKMTPDEMTSLIRVSNYVSLPQISYFYQKRKVQTQKFDDEMAYITQDRVNDILHRIRRVISPSPFTQV